MPKVTTFGRQSWSSAATTAVQPKMLRTKRWIAASLTAAGQALFAGLASKPDRRVLNDVVTEIEGEPDRGHHKRTQNENRPA